MTMRLLPHYPPHWTLVLCLLLAGCGGGGAAQDASLQSAANQLVASCESCGAIGPNHYAGSGIGIWHWQNTGTSAQDAEILLSGLTNQDVTLVFTNETAASVSLTPIQHSVSTQTLPMSSRVMSSSPRERIREYNHSGWSVHLGAANTLATGTTLSGFNTAPLSNYTVGSARGFYHWDESTRQATLKAQSVTSDGTVVNIWVENSEFDTGKVTAPHVTALAASFVDPGKTYDTIKALGGPLWGSHAYPSELIGASQPIDIVVLNIEPNQQPYGEVGYFWAMHNFLRSALPNSNESLSLYLDSETIYLDGNDGFEAVISTAAHEAMHLANFYRRGVKMGPSAMFDLWLEELSAMMAEDLLATRLALNVHPIRDQRLPVYLAFGNYNCALMNFGSCESYSVTGSFGGFLLRQLGVSFFSNLLAQTTTNSTTALNNAIRSVRPSSSLGQEVRRFAAATGAALPANAPAGFGFPGRFDSGYEVVPISVEAYKHLRNLPASTPATLRPYASYPLVRRSVSGTFSETLRVPPGVTLSVVVN